MAAGKTVQVKGKFGLIIFLLLFAGIFGYFMFAPPSEAPTPPAGAIGATLERGQVTTIDSAPFTLAYTDRSSGYRTRTNNTEIYDEEQIDDIFYINVAGSKQAACEPGIISLNQDRLSERTKQVLCADGSKYEVTYHGADINFFQRRDRLFVYVKKL